MSMDVIATLAQAAGFASQGRRFHAPDGPAFDLIAAVARGAALAQPGEKQAGGLSSIPKLWRGAMALGGLGTAAVTGKHLHNDSVYNPGRRLMNPLTWFSPTSDEHAFQEHNNAYMAHAEPFQKKIEEASNKGDFTEAEKLQGRLDKGDLNESSWYDPTSWSYGMGGWNPFAAKTPAYHQEKARGIQDKYQTDYDNAMKQVGAQPGDFARIDTLRSRLKTQSGLLPSQAAGLQSQLSALEKRVRQEPGTPNDEARDIFGKMRAMGMRVNEFRRPNANWDTGWGHNYNGPPQSPNAPTGRQYDYPRQGRPPNTLDWSYFAQ